MPSLTIDLHVLYDLLSEDVSAPVPAFPPQWRLSRAGQLLLRLGVELGHPTWADTPPLTRARLRRLFAPLALLTAAETVHAQGL